MDTGLAQRGPWSPGRHVPRKVAILPRGIAIAAENVDLPPMCDPYHSEHTHIPSSPTPSRVPYDTRLPHLIGFFEMLVGYHPL